MSDSNKDRDYESIPLSTIERKIGDNEIELLKTIYSEINSNYRHLTDIRFKLLGLVPAVSVISWVEITNKFTPDSIESMLLGIIISTFGLIITMGIRIYDKRNDQLYGDIMNRGKIIEEELKIDNGVFRGRLKGYKDEILGFINHKRGLRLIYASVFSGWGLLIFWYVINLNNYFLLNK